MASSPSTTIQHTLWLWNQGMFPRRVTYFLLEKGLCDSAADVLAGKTNEPSSLRIHLMEPNLTGDSSKGFWLFTPADDPAPEGASTPCLRVTDTSSGKITYIHESMAIIRYLDAFYTSPSRPSLAPSDPLSVARMNDIIDGVGFAFAESGTYLRHAAPKLAQFVGLKDELRSKGIAEYGLAGTARLLGRVQSWAELDGPEGEGKKNMLTPGMDNGKPGLADFALASGVRYLELGYGWEMLGMEGGELAGLKAWYGRFKESVGGWWGELEEREGVHPEALKFEREF